MKFDIENATVQEACDYAVQMLVKQGGRCLSYGGGGCAYGNRKGQHCAIGWLLDHDDDELMKYYSDLEGLFHDHRDALPQVVLDNPVVFEYLQAFHDIRDVRDRNITLERLREEGIDVSGSHWREWLTAV